MFLIVAESGHLTVVPSKARNVNRTGALLNIMTTDTSVVRTCNNITVLHIM